MARRKPDPRELVLADLRGRLRELREHRKRQRSATMMEACEYAIGIIETVIADLEAQP